jgi:glutathione S-transferase
MKLHHHPMSANARRAVMTAIHLGAPVELVLVDLAKGEQKSPAFVAKNPNGRVPVLDDGDLVLTESHAIAQYLCDKTPGNDIYPTELRARAVVNQWLFWSAHHWQPAIGVLTFEHMVKGFRGLGAADPKEVARGERAFHECARVLDAQLREREWIAADRITIADYGIASPLMAIEVAKIPVADYRHVLRWLDRVKATEAWKKTEPPR